MKIIHSNHLAQVISAISILSIMFLASISCAAEPPQTYTDPTTEMQFVLIPGGSFEMGHPNDQWAQPVHTVTLQPFYIGKFEVTFDQYDQFCEETKRQKPKDMGWGRAIRPVINVSWDDSVAFAKWLSKKSGKKLRLPTEAEWEYAARAGTSTYFYWGDKLGRSNANCKDCGSNFDNKKTAVIGSFSPNQFGLFDMLGNVYEWCQDVWHESYEGAPTDGSAWTKGNKEHLKVTRGGSWMQPVNEITTSRRCYHNHPNKRSEVGIRLVMEP